MGQPGVLSKTTMIIPLSDKRISFGCFCLAV